MRRAHGDVIGFSINYSSNYILPIVSINNPRRLILSTIRVLTIMYARRRATRVLASSQLILRFLEGIDHTYASRAINGAGMRRILLSGDLD